MFNTPPLEPRRLAATYMTFDDENNFIEDPKNPLISSFISTYGQLSMMIHAYEQFTKKLDQINNRLNSLEPLDEDTVTIANRFLLQFLRNETTQTLSKLGTDMEAAFASCSAQHKVLSSSRIQPADSTLLFQFEELAKSRASQYERSDAASSERSFSPMD